MHAIINTDKGPLKVEFYEQDAPNTVANFVKLAKDGFYNGLNFHRVIPDFVVQGGCPHGIGTGGPGYQFQDECQPELKHSSEGIFSMANAGPGTNGSQFFITLVPTPHLNGHHTVFGKVIEGMDIIHQIGKTATNRDDRPLEDVVMKKVTVVRD